MPFFPLIPAMAAGAGAGGGAGGFMSALPWISGGLQGLGSIFGGGGQGDYPGGSAIGRPEWWQLQGDVMGQYGGMRDFNRRFTPQYQAQLQKALGGEMGLSPELIRMMFSRGMGQLRPEFEQQRESLQGSFSPRLLGSGAAGGAMSKLLAEQARTTQGLSSDINIQDLLARTGAQRQGLGQMGDMWGTSQAMQNAASQSWLRWLGM